MLQMKFGHDRGFKSFLSVSDTDIDDANNADDGQRTNAYRISSSWAFGSDELNTIEQHTIPVNKIWIYVSLSWIV